MCSGKFSDESLSYINKFFGNTSEYIFLEKNIQIKVVSREVCKSKASWKFIPKWMDQKFRRGMKIFVSMVNTNTHLLSSSPPTQTSTTKTQNFHLKNWETQNSLLPWPSLASILCGRSDAGTEVYLTEMTVWRNCKKRSYSTILSILRTFWSHPR